MIWYNGGMKTSRSGRVSRRRGVETDPKSPLFDQDDYARTCSSKTSYENEWRAKFAIDEMRERFGADLHSYKCPYCGRFHLTERRLEP